MGFKEMIEKFRNKDTYFKELQARDKAMTKVSERKLSSEERSLNKILEKKRQEDIKKQLNTIYKKEESDYWHKDVISQPFIFKHDKSLFMGGGKKII